MPQHYLGIDVGTTAVKALVVNELGSVVGEAESPLRVSVPRPGWAEQNPSGWWQGTVHAVRAACAQADIREVESVGLSGQMHSSVFLNDTDTALRPAILWNDVRTTAQCRFITDSIGRRACVGWWAIPLSRDSPRPSSCGCVTSSPACSTRYARSFYPRTTCVCP